MREPVLFLIKDFAEICDVQPSTLRYWNEIGLLLPAWRNEKNGYRYYLPEQIMMVSMIKMLHALDIPLRKMVETKEASNLQQIFKLLCLCDREMEEKIQEMRLRMQLRKDVLRSYASLIEECRTTRPGEIEQRRLAERPIQRIPIERGKKSFRELFRQAHNNGSPMGYAYHDLNSLLEKPDQPAQLVFYDPQGPDVRPAGQYLVGTAHCPYGKNSGLAQRIRSYALQNRIELRGPAYVVYLLDKADVTEREPYLLQIAVRLT